MNLKLFTRTRTSCPPEIRIIRCKQNKNNKYSFSFVANKNFANLIDCERVHLYFDDKKYILGLHLGNNLSFPSYKISYHRNGRAISCTSFINYYGLEKFAGKSYRVNKGSDGIWLACLNNGIR